MFDLIDYIFMVVAFVLVAFCVISLVRFDDFVDVTKYDICSIGVDSSSSGHFVLGTGRVDDKLYYYAYKLNDDMGKELVQLDSSDVVIYDVLDSDNQPYVEKHRHIMGFTKIYVYVPKGSIIEEYKINMKDL